MLFNAIVISTVYSSIIAYPLEDWHYRKIQTAVCKKLRYVLCGAACHKSIPNLPNPDGWSPPPLLPFSASPLSVDLGTVGRLLGPCRWTP
jgi:hypothetical protein